jgi:hypothetical protein
MPRSACPGTHGYETTVNDPERPSDGRLRVALSAGAALAVSPSPSGRMMTQAISCEPSAKRTPGAPQQPAIRVPADALNLRLNPVTLVRPPS